MAKSRQFGKNERDDYRSITGRVPEEIKRRAKARAVFDDLDINTLVEGLLSLYVSERITAAAIREAVAGESTPEPNADAVPDRLDLGEVESAARMRAVRERLELSQTEFGELIGRGRRSVSEYERGTTEIPPEVIERLDELERGIAEGG